MARKFYTIMVIPHARASFRKIQVSQASLRCGIGAAVTLVVATLLLPGYLVLSTHRGRVVRELSQENADLKSANEQYDEDLAQLRRQLAGFETKATKFALMAGVEDLPTDRMPAGSPGEMMAEPGAPDPAYLTEELGILKGRSEALGESYRLLDEAWTDQELRLATTPSIAPTRGIMGSGYSYRRDPFTGTRELHAGLDIVANAGTPVVSPADGIVTRAGRMGGYGKAVFVSHGNGLATRYAHLSQVAVQPGQKLSRGDVLGHVGATGRALGYHLHYEVLVNNRKVDPRHYIIDESRID